MTTAQALLDSDFALLSDLIAAHAAERPDAVALVDDDQRLSYADVDAMVDRIAAALQRDGLKRGQAVAIGAMPSANYALVFLGALRAGGAATPLTASAAPAALANMIADCGTAHLFLDAEMAETLKDVHLLAGIDLIALDLNTAGTPLEGWIEDEGATPARVEVGPDDPFNIIYSSGTTGNPKGIVQSHRMRWGHIRRAGASGYGRDAVTLISTPLYSNTTLVAFVPTLAHGGTAVIMRKFDARRFLELSEAERVTHAMLVPVQYKRLMERPDFGDFDLSAYRVKFCTSAPFSAALKADILARWPGGLVEYYGMTEGGGTCILLAHEHPDKLDTVGRAAPGHDVRVIDAAGNPLPPGEKGEVVGRSEAMMTGYHNQPGKTREAEWFDAEGNRFIRTGDIGAFDADGFLTLLGRAKDMIISGGFNIYPGDLEDALMAHDDVTEAAVVGAPSEDWGETPVGFVVAVPGTNPDPEALRQFANAQLGKTQRLSAVHVVDAMPRNEIGKILKRELRERLG